MKFTITTSTDGQCYFEAQSDGNHETLATSETYRDKADARRAIDLIKKEAAAAQVIDHTTR